MKTDFLKFDAGLSYVLRTIDFQKIQAFMQLTKWHYRNEDHPPSLRELETTVEELFSKCWEASVNGDSHFSCGTGGFFAILEYGQIKVFFSISGANASL